MKYSLQFQTLQAEAEHILDSSTRKEICESASNSINRLLDAPHNQLYLYSRRNESLETMPRTSNLGVDTSTGESTNTIGPHIDTTTISQNDESVLWDVYDSTGGVLVESSPQIEHLVSDSCPFNTGIITPLGPYGVLFILESGNTTFTDTDVGISEFLAEAVTRALDSERRERGLATVQAISRDAMTAETHAEMSDKVLNRLPELLDYPICMIWKYNEYEHQLEPIATTEPAQESCPNTRVFEAGGSIAWDVFTNDETRVITDVNNHFDVHTEDSLIESEVLTSIGDFGLFAAMSTHRGSFNNTEKQIIDALSTNLQTITKLVERHRESQLLDEVIGRVIRHNTRNELNAIKGFGKQLHNTGECSNNMYYDEFTKACERLDETAQNANLMRKVVRNRENTTPINVADVTENVVDEVNSEFENANVTYDRDCTKGCTQIDLHLNFRDCIKELVVNGIKHNESDQTPIVDVEVIESRRVISIVVSDNGPGIPSVEQDVLNDETETALQHGSGAGLWVVDRVVSYSGGMLNFTVGDGTTVEVVFSKHSL